MAQAPWWRWALPAALFVVNVGVLGFYQLRYAGQVGEMQGLIDAETAELHRVEAQRRALSGLVERARSGREGIEALYTEYFSTESARLTATIREVKDLAAKAGLQRAESISYPDEDVEDYGLLKRSLVFSVQGSYAQLRQFVNLLELSESFVVLEQINVSGVSPNLNVSLRISTLFSGRDRPLTREERRPRRAGRNA